MFDVITMGSATVDVFNVISKKLSEPRPGDKVLVEKLDFEIGGGGVNSAIAFSRMGLNTAFLGKVGCDHNAVNIIRELKKEDVTFLHLKPSKLPTSHSFILMSKKEKDRIIYAYKGASDDLKTNEINFKQLKTRWIYIDTLLGPAFKTAENVAAFAKKNDIKVMFNPSSYLAAKGKNDLKKILRCSDVLVLNKSEAKLLLGTKHDSVKYLLKELRKLGPKIVRITEGNKGAYAYNGQKFIHIPSPRVIVVYTAGAGDAFESSFLAGLIKGEDIETSLKIGSVNACSVIQYYGTKNKLLSYNKAKKIITKTR